MATVLEPLKHLHGEQYELGPLVVLCKPEHGRRILAGADQQGFSPKAAYIFLKQLEEADVVVINKVDKLTADQVTELTGLVRTRFPNKQILTASGLHGMGFEALVDVLAAHEPPARRAIDVDYEVYAEGEAELGWLNCNVALEAAPGSSFELDAVVTELVDRLAMALRESGAEPAHLKVLGQVGQHTCVANLVSGDEPVEHALVSSQVATRAQLVVNARVGGDPKQLAELFRREVQALAAMHHLAVAITAMQQFRPAPPRPTHRYMPA